MKTFFKWFAGFFQDQAGTASSKRATLYIALFFLWTIIQYVVTKDLPFPDMMVLYSVVGVILVCLGIVGAEFFKSKPFGGSLETDEKVENQEEKNHGTFGKPQ